MTNIRNLDLRTFAVISLLTLWVSTTFSIALMEIAFVAALVFWGFIRLKHPVLDLVAAQLNTGCSGGVKFPASPAGRQMLTKADWGLWGPLAAFFLAVLISYFTSEYPQESFRGILKIGKPLLAFIMCADLFRNRENQTRFDLVFLIAFLLVLTDASFQYFFGKDFLRGFTVQESSAGLRVVGPFGDFGKMSSYLILVIPVFALQTLNESKKLKNIKRLFSVLAGTIMTVVLLYLTRCRAPMLALVISFFFLLIYKRWFRALGIYVLLLFLFFVTVPRSMIIHRDVRQQEQSLHERYYLWRRALDVIFAKPLIGTGINTYNRAHAKYDTLQKKNLLPFRGTAYRIRQSPDGSVSFSRGDVTYTSDPKQSTVIFGSKLYNIFRDAAGEYYLYNDLIVRNYYAHNGYLQLAAEIGIPGILFFLLFLVMFFRRGLQAANTVRGSPEELEQLGILTGLLAFLIYALADTNLQSPQTLMEFWYMAGILLAKQNLDPISTRRLTSGSPNLTPGVKNKRAVPV